nr:MAG TPA: hypothetical protein [Caudoviricetes sp.]
MRKIDFNDPPKNENWEIPQEVYDYVLEHGYAEKMIPLDLEECKKIFAILKKEYEDSAK